jgi:hypothetical protein
MATGRDSVLAYLRRQGGELLSADGRGITRRMASTLGYKLGSLGRVLSDLEHEGVIEREIRGKRTYRIGLSETMPRTTVAVGELPTAPRDSHPARPTEAEDILSLLIEIGVLERNFEQTVQHIERLRLDVESLMDRCRRRMAESGPVTIDLRGQKRPSTNGTEPSRRRPAATAG